MPLISVPIYRTRNLATEIDPGARTILPGTNVTFTTAADGTITINVPGALGGDVVGPASAVNNNFAAFNGTTGKIIKDSGVAISSLGNYVLKAGDTMTGTLFRTGSGVGLELNTSNINIRMRSPATTNTSANFDIGQNPTGTAGDNNAYIVNRVGAIDFYTANVARGQMTAAGALNWTGQITAGTLQSTGVSYSGQNFESTTTNVILANNGSAGGVFLRPNGAASGTGQLVVNNVGTVTTSGGINANGNVIVTNADLYSYRAGGTTGVIFLNNAATRYLYYDGTKYILNAAKLEVGGDIDSGGTITANTLGTSPMKMGVWPGSANYTMIGWTGMTGTEYGMLMGSGDLNTYVSSRTGGNVVIRPSANGTAGEATFATTGMTLNPASGGKLLSKISLGTAAPGALANGELYLRY